MPLIARFLRSDDGATSVEYAVVLALILMAVVGAIGAVGAETGGMWSGIWDDLKATNFGK